MLPGRKSDEDSMVDRSSCNSRDYNMRDVILTLTSRRSVTVNIEMKDAGTNILPLPTHQRISRKAVHSFSQKASGK